MKRVLFLLLATIHCASLAITCPDLSSSKEIPPGWRLLEFMHYSDPESRNGFRGASYQLTAHPSLQPILCTYLPASQALLSTFTIGSITLYPMPQEGGWSGQLSYDFLFCSGPDPKNCPFSDIKG